MLNALIYGSNGYTGRLIAGLAASYGLKPILAGRNAAAVQQQAERLELDHRVFTLADPLEINDGLRDVAAVLHCAGPFAFTAQPMAEACLRNRVHYLDITGEIEVMEMLATRDEAARGAGIMLMPGTGFDVVPSDCVALHLKNRLPTATHLMLAIRGTGGLSHGTATTMVEHRSRGGVVRRNGKLVSVPNAWRSREVDFGDGKLRTTITIPWGDIATAYRTTAIPNIEVYAAVAKPVKYLAKATRYIGPVLGSPLVRKALKKRIDARPAGPDEHQLQHGSSFVWGRVEDDAGAFAEARLRGPNGYLLTAHTALMVLQRVMKGDVAAGFQTPARQYGEDFILGVAGTTLT
jgi:short subunit dehydrogenase-like uncharacterized protein